MIRKYVAAVLTIAASQILPAPGWAQGGWEFTVSPYGWMSGLEGDVGTLPGYPSQPVDLSFGDVLNDLDYAFFLTGSARNDPWVLYFDGSLVQTTSSETLGGPVLQGYEIKSKTANFALAFGTTIRRSDRHYVDAYAGFRHWSLNNTYSVTTIGGSYSQDADASWTDPIVGVAGNYRLGERWVAFGAADIGGFGVGSDFQWSVMVGVNYLVTDSVSVGVGWRHMDVDYDKDGVVYNASQSGPVMGVTVRF